MDMLISLLDHPLEFSQKRFRVVFRRHTMAKIGRDIQTTMWRPPSHVYLLKTSLTRQWLYIYIIHICMYQQLYITITIVCIFIINQSLLYLYKSPSANFPWGANRIRLPWLAVRASKESNEGRDFSLPSMREVQYLTIDLRALCDENLGTIPTGSSRMVDWC